VKQTRFPDGRVALNWQEFKCVYYTHVNRKFRQ